MKKKELLNILNSGADSISLHDGSLIAFNRKENSLTLLVCIGEYHYHLNELEKYIDNLKSNMVLSLTFFGVKNFESSLDENFQICDCEIISNDSANNVYTLMLSDFQQYGEISFLYESFSWDIIE